MAGTITATDVTLNYSTSSDTISVLNSGGDNTIDDAVARGEVPVGCVVSRAGEPIARAKQAAEMLLGRLAPTDLTRALAAAMRMSEAVRNKLFEPFFTTKKVGKGTGLGLFIANKIVGKHGGTIDVRSEAGRGSRFVIRLPLVPRPSTGPATSELAEA